MGREAREEANLSYKKLGRPLPYPGDKVKGEEEVIIKETKSKGKK